MSVGRRIKRLEAMVRTAGPTLIVAGGEADGSLFDLGNGAPIARGELPPNAYLVVLTQRDDGPQ